MEIEGTKHEKIGDVKIEYFENFFGERKDYFIPKLIALEYGDKYSFNIGAFLFGMFWFLYRKLYIHSLIIFLIVMVESKIEEIILSRIGYTQDMDITMRVIWLIISGVIFGYFGNYFFLKQSKKRVEKIISSTDDEAIKMKRLIKSGSGNWTLVLSIILILVLAVIFLQK